MQLRLIPAGTFMMGSNESKESLEQKGMSLYEGFDNSDEQPRHLVRITRSFYMGAHEVTLGQFLNYYNADKVNHKTDAEKDGQGGYGYDGSQYEQKPSYVAWNTGWNQPVEQYMDHPVVNVSWNDATGFCKWLTTRERQTGRIGADQEYRLPTEAEWEYACRGGGQKSTLFSFGDSGEELKIYGNIKDAEYARKFSNPYGSPIAGNDGYVFTAPVGSFKPNAFGLYDMHGNVWELCMDVYDAGAYSQRSGETRDPIVTTGGWYRVGRGGGSDDSP